MSNIIIAFPKLENGKGLKDILVRNGFRVTHVCTSGSQALSAAQELSDGVILISHRLPDMMYWQVREYMPRGFEMIVMTTGSLWSESGSPEVVSLNMPFKVGELLSTVEMVESALHRRIKKERQRPPRKRTAEEQELIDRAKAMLMDRNHMTEDSAHRYLQKTAMDNGSTLTETAQLILSLMDK